MSFNRSVHWISYNQHVDKNTTITDDSKNGVYADVSMTDAMKTLMPYAFYTMTND